MATLRHFACRDFDGYSDANEFCADLIRINCVTWRDILDRRAEDDRRANAPRHSTRPIANTTENLSAGAVEQASAGPSIRERYHFGEGNFRTRGTRRSCVLLLNTMLHTPGWPDGDWVLCRNLLARASAARRHGRCPPHHDEFRSAGLNLVCAMSAVNFSTDAPQSAR